MLGPKTTIQHAHDYWCYSYWPPHCSHGIRGSPCPLSVLNLFAHVLADSAKLLISVRTPSTFKSGIRPRARIQQVLKVWEEEIHYTVGSTSARCVCAAPLHCTIPVCNHLKPMDEIKVTWHLHWIGKIGKDFIPVQWFIDFYMTFNLQCLHVNWLAL